MQPPQNSGLALRLPPPGARVPPAREPKRHSLETDSKKSLDITPRLGYIVGVKRISKSAAAANRLEYLRQELRAERISYGELSELQSLVKYIDKGDVELLEAAGVPEHHA